MMFDDVFKLRLSLICGVLAVVICAGCKTAQPAYTTIPNQDFAYSFNQPPFISPRIIQDLSTWISDQGDQVVAVNVLEAQNCNRYSGEPEVRTGQNPCVVWKEVTVLDSITNESEFSYQYVGRTDSGIYVLLTGNWGGGSGVFMNLLLVKFEYDQGISCDWERGIVESGKKRLLIKKVGEIPLGDRWDGALSVEGNSVVVGKDKGIFAGTKKGGTLSLNPEDRVLKIDIETTGPKTRAPPATTL
jgi:hypothetical protein